MSAWMEFPLEGTLTASWQASGALEFRGEVRGDNSTHESHNKDGVPVKSQTTISVSALVFL
ncbi:MAG: hypothetical protein H7318_03710 [Oligoflexus sp.]|nr:hypothetical protein [Oligoflexus sp.]